MLPEQRPGEDAAEWGFRTGRYRREDVADWRKRDREQRNRVLASGRGTDEELNAVESVIASLYPAYAPGMSALAERIADDDEDDQGNLARRVLASAGLDQNGQPLAAASGGRSGTPLLDAIERDIYGPTREEVHRQQDLAAERELAAQIDHERLLASTGLSEGHYRELFGEH